MPELYELGRTRARLQPRIQEFGRPLFGGSSGGFSPQTTTAAPEASGAFGGGSLGNVGTLLSALSALRSAQESGLLDGISEFLPSSVTNFASQLLGGGGTPGTTLPITTEGRITGAITDAIPTNVPTNVPANVSANVPALPPPPVSSPINVPASLLPLAQNTASGAFLPAGASAATADALASLVGPTVPAGTPAAITNALPGAASLEIAPAAAAKGGLGTLSQFGSALGSTLTGTNLAGVGGPLGAAAFPSGTSVATALGTIAPPVAAILGIAALGGAFSGPGNTPAAVNQATDVVTKILMTSNPTSGQLERAKALLGQPNTFEDPNPGTQAHFGGIENRINALGGIDALSPAAREIYVSALARRQADRIRSERAAAERLGAPLRPSTPVPAQTRPPILQPPPAVDFRTILPNTGGMNFGDPQAGRLMRQGLTARQAEEQLRNVGR